MKVATPQDLFLDDLKDLLDAEKQLTRALPKMAKAAHDPELQQAFREHLDVTREQVHRLERIFEMLGAPARGKQCHGMKGIVEEGQELMEEDRSGAIMDSSIAAGARKVEHYEIAAYEGARLVAQQLGHREAGQLLEQTLQEEMQADKRLAQISRRLVKEASQMAPGGEEEMVRGRGRGRATAGRRRGRVAAAGRSMVE
jgi:ferritin-like metal-binding protein YciE